MQFLSPLLASFLCLSFLHPGLAIGQEKTVAAKRQSGSESQVFLDSPITASYLAENLSKESPRIFLTPTIEAALKEKLKSDLLVKSYYRYLKNEAEKILTQPLLKRRLEGFRMITVSGVMLNRLSILSIVYRIDRDPKILTRIDAELQNVCRYRDWNPQHFLDISIMSLGVSIAVDWVGEWLPPETVSLAKTALIDKAIVPSYNESGERMQWINGNNNWNSVCHGGMVVAALAVADVDPELAAKTITRALDKLPKSLAAYGPDGVYPEGPSYWCFGTSYAVFAANALTTALGDDFGISRSPGFMASADFRLLATGPSGAMFNFADSDDRDDGESLVLLAWFAAKTGDATYLDKRFFAKPKNAGRIAALGLVWLSQFTETNQRELPLVWCGHGRNPVAFFRGEKNDPRQFYLAAKGGCATISHGNMDAGSFVFDLNGVRWSIDPGNQSYGPLNNIGFQLSNYQQDSERWSLLTKGNQSHSTITVNDARFVAKGEAAITNFQATDQPSVTIDLSNVIGNQLTSLQRRFVQESDHSILIEDSFETNATTQTITWAMMTVAEVVPRKNGAVLKQNGTELQLEILVPNNAEVMVVQLDPPPLKIDKTIKNLQRIEIRVAAKDYADGKGSIRVRLSGE